MSRSARRRSAPAGRTWARSRRAPDEFGQRLEGEAVRLLGADAHAQRVRQPVAGDLAQDQPARSEELVRVLRGPALLGRKVDEHEVGGARRDLEAELADLL